VIPIVPIYFALRARTRIRESGGTRDGNGLAMLGLAVGVAELVAGLALLLVGVDAV
jgi:hypothetical protein